MRIANQNPLIPALFLLCVLLPNLFSQENRLETKQDELISLFQKNFLQRVIPSGSPLNNSSITSHYGYRIHPITNKKSFHTGIDFRAKVGTPVYATADGVILHAGISSNPRVGISVIVKHNSVYKSYFLHLSKVKVKKGDKIKRGQIIALTGNTGIGTAPHLHYTLKENNNSIDPLRLMAFNKNKYLDLYAKHGIESLTSLN